MSLERQSAFARVTTASKNAADDFKRLQTSLQIAIETLRHTREIGIAAAQTIRHCAAKPLSTSGILNALERDRTLLRDATKAVQRIEPPAVTARSSAPTHTAQIAARARLSARPLLLTASAANSAFRAVQVVISRAGIEGAATTMRAR